MKKKRVRIHHQMKTHRYQKGIHQFGNGYLAFYSVIMFFFGMVLGSGYLLTHPHVCANSISCITDLTGTYKENASGEYMGQRFTPPPYIADNPLDQAVLGASIGTNKHIFIDLTNQRLMAFEGNTLVYNFTVSTGWWNLTPTGDFNIWIKLRYATMVGGDKAKGDYYNLPNIPFVMYFYNADHPKWEGYGIHDAYWLTTADFGHPRSHGCINLSYADAQTLYNWATPTTGSFATFATDTNPGTPVTIYGTTPNHYW